MNGFLCPFCNMTMVDNYSTHRMFYLPDEHNGPVNKKNIRFDFFICPNCDKTTVFANRPSGDDAFSSVVYPQSIFIHFPDYIPAAIRQDYEEASSIKTLSPKAAATLCRRCLQGMIRDFWGIRKGTLNEEISALKGKIPASQWEVIDAVRKIGNIGAHMEKDVNLIIDIEPDEASKLILLIERLIQAWYVERHTEQELYNDILNINQAAQEKRAP